MRSRLLGVAMSFLVLGGQALNGIPAAAASAPGAPTVVQELKHDRSGPLRSALPDQAPNDLGNRHYQPIRPRGLTPKAALPPGPVQTAAGPSAMPSTSANFEGISNLDNVLPPDTNGDIGPNHYVQWVNLRYEIFSRTGTSILGPSPGNTLWSGFGGVCQTTNQGDPIVRYDRMADRWVFTQFAFNVDFLGNPVAPYVECLAVSTTGDPTGSYYRYAYQISSTLFNDYPKLSVWPDGYYMTFNYFSGNTFVGAGAWAFDRSKMLSGLAANAVNFQTTSAYGGLLASDLDGSIMPPAGSPNYVAAVDNPVSGSVAIAGSKLFIWKFHVDWTTPANSTFGTAAHTPDFNLAVASYKWDPCGASQNCIPQPGTTVGLDPIADRLMNRLQYRHFADGHESLVANHTVGVGTSGNQTAIRWYEIRNLSTTPTIYQQGTFSPDSNNRWMGSLAMDQSGDIGLGYSVSSSSVSPSIRYTGRLAGDPLGTLPQGEATMVAGSGSQTSSYNRWGDYSMMAVDPTDDCTFWYTQEYYTAISDRGWRTRVGSFKFPNCGLAWYAAYAVTNTPGRWTANQTQTFSVTITNAGNQNWPAGGANPVRLGVHFANRGGGYGVNGSGTAVGAGWTSDQRIVLPADLAPGASVTLTIAVTAPNTGGNQVIEYQAVKENQFWFAQFADVNVSVASWVANYSVTNTPTSWTANQTQTFSVTITNAGNQSWPAGGANPVRLGVHFANRGGGYGVNGSGTAVGAGWTSDQRIVLPADLAPGASVTLTIAVTAPNTGGNQVIEYQAVKENQFWFAQFADVNVSVASWVASYSVTNTPTSWTANQTQTFSVTITNAGNQNWPAGGANPVRLGVHFANRGGGYGVNGSGTAVGAGWTSDQRIVLPADLAPGASVTLTIAVTAPNTGGNQVIEYQAVKENQFWFAQFADVNVSVT